jgi:hypothetical protein
MLICLLRKTQFERGEKYDIKLQYANRRHVVSATLGLKLNYFFFIELDSILCH